MGNGEVGVKEITLLIKHFTQLLNKAAAFIVKNKRF